jgi:hypothetical protein
VDVRARGQTVQTADLELDPTPPVSAVSAVPKVESLAGCAFAFGANVAPTDQRWLCFGSAKAEGFVLGQRTLRRFTFCPYE